MICRLFFRVPRSARPIVWVGLGFVTLAHDALSAASETEPSPPAIAFASEALTATADGQWRQTWLLAGTPGSIRLLTEAPVGLAVVNTNAVCPATDEATSSVDHPIGSAPLTVCYRAYDPLTTQLLVEFRAEGSEQAERAVATLTFVDDAFYTGALFTAIMPVFLALLAGLLWPVVLKAVQQGQDRRAAQAALALEYDGFILKLFKELEVIQEGLADAATSVDQKRAPALDKLTHGELKNAGEVAEVYAALTLSPSGQNQLAALAAFGQELDTLVIGLDALASEPAESDAWQRATSSIVSAQKTLVRITKKGPS